MCFEGIVIFHTLLFAAWMRDLKHFKMHTFEVKKDKNVQQIKEEGSIQEEGGHYEKLKIPILPPNSPRSGITFHLET